MQYSRAKVGLKPMVWIEHKNIVRSLNHCEIDRVPLSRWNEQISKRKLRLFQQFTNALFNLIYLSADCRIGQQLPITEELRLDLSVERPPNTLFMHINLTAFKLRGKPCNL